MAVSFGVALKEKWIIGWIADFGGLLVGQMLGVLLEKLVGTWLFLPYQALLGDQLLEGSQPLPLKTRLHAGNANPLHYRYRFEHIDNIVQPADLCLDLRWILGVHQHLRGVLQSHWLFRTDEEAQESGSQVFQRLFALAGHCVLLTFLDGFDGFHRLFEAPPDVLILLELPYDL